MMPIHPTMWQAYPASERDLMDFLLSLDLTPEQLQRGLDYLVPRQTYQKRGLVKVCQEQGCTRGHKLKGFCQKHYAARRRQLAKLQKPQILSAPVVECSEERSTPC